MTARHDWPTLVLLVLLRLLANRLERFRLSEAFPSFVLSPLMLNMPMTLTCAERECEQFASKNEQTEARV